MLYPSLTIIFFTFATPLKCPLIYPSKVQECSSEGIVGWKCKNNRGLPLDCEIPRQGDAVVPAGSGLDGWDLSGQRLCKNSLFSVCGKKGDVISRSHLAGIAGNSQVPAPVWELP
ncbi:hypothetical protein EK904_008113 [Melospiza melodia maxima]|nr:hypothetical protein EK904_008113 [Melospiza melodia maxima]